MRVALATCAAFPRGDEDDAALSGALAGATWERWDDPAVDWDAFDRVLIRSTWDYTERRDDFLAWCERVGAQRLRNPPQVVRFSSDKRYLADLAVAGLPVVATAFVAPGEALPALGGAFVVKPTVSAGSRDTQRFAPGEDATPLLDAIHASGRTAMVQPYLDGVDEAGETALLFLGGAYSHAIRKGPMLTGEASLDPSGAFLTEAIEPREPSADERAVGDAVMAWVGERFGTLVYARVDLLPSPEGPVLVELELVEPSLFFAQGGPDAVARLAAAALSP